MNKIFLIGNLVRDPDSRTTQNGTPVCSFSIAVNRRQSAQAGQPDADFFRVVTWRTLAESCSKYLNKGRKVSVVGSVHLATYTAQNGENRANLEVQADDVEFIGPYEKPAQNAPETPKTDEQSGFVQVDEKLPF